MIYLTLTTSGTHTIFVADRYNATGNYGLDLQRVAPPSPNAAIIRFGQAVQATIQPMGDTDLYAFRGVAGDSVIVRASASLGVRAELYDPDGIRINGSPATLTKTGIHTVRVTEAFNDSLVNYTLDLQCIGVCPAPGDIDLDGVPDTCEVQFGLLPFNPADANADPDGDGLSNLAECQTGTHPRGFFTRYLAEGATNAFFDTRLALLNSGRARRGCSCAFCSRAAARWRVRAAAQSAPAHARRAPTSPGSVSPRLLDGRRIRTSRSSSIAR